MCLNRSIEAFIIAPCIVLALSFASTLGLPAAAAPPAMQASGATVSVWHPAPALAVKLGPAVIAGEYSLRPPVGYSEVPLSPRMVKAEDKYGFVSHYYASSAHSGAAAALLLITAAKLRPGKAGTNPLDVALQDILVGKQQEWQKAVLSKPESGLVGGHPFERAYFQGVDPSHGDPGHSAPRPAHGVAYVTVDGSKIVSIVAEAYGPGCEQQWPVAEAAALTFHKP